MARSAPDGRREMRERAHAHLGVISETCVVYDCMRADPPRAPPYTLQCIPQLYGRYTLPPVLACTASHACVSLLKAAPSPPAASGCTARALVR